MAKTIQNRKIHRHTRFAMPQEMIDICEELAIPKYLRNYFGNKGFVISKGKSGDVFRLTHHRWGSIAHPKSDVNEWSKEDIRHFLHEKYHFKNKVDDPKMLASLVLREKWFREVDLNILMAVYHHRILTTSQLHAMGFYTSKSALRQVRERCKKLVDNHILESFQPIPNEFIGSMENHYMLGEVGSHLVAHHENININQLGWTPQHNEIMMHTVYHTVEINNVFLAYRQVQKDGFHVKETIAEYLITEKVQANYQSLRFNPDGLMSLMYQEKERPFFLEVDRNTMKLHDFAEKVPRYEAYAKTMKWKAQFAFFPIVLVATTSEKRMLELARSVKKKQKINSISWLFTTLDQMKETPLAEIFVNAQDAEKETFTTYSILDAFRGG
ncbi:replication-relaxation family protein [Longirhabdus pacifica]|uniref:replication-relaxation family protein n=1 Tax=Longirhabdus pacifica TaxID=2305227 RepID=UPI00100874DA|nr:replication-relaxation family protein [Longirhabdus pacifica]